MNSVHRLTVIVPVVSPKIMFATHSAKLRDEMFVWD